MTLHFTIDQAFRIFDISNRAMCIWRIKPDAGRLAFAFREILRVFSILIVMSMMAATLCATYYQRHDLMIMMKAASETIVSLNLLGNLVLCELLSTSIQHLQDELKDSLRTFNDDEMIILQKYINRYSNVFTFTAIWQTFSIIAFCCGPIFLPMKYPAEAYYPFPTESLIVISILYATQVYTIVLAGFAINVDFMLSIFFCYSSAKLEMLWTEMQNVKDNMQIKYYVKKHHKIIEYVNKSKYVARYILFKTNIFMVLIVVCAAFSLLHDQSNDSSFLFIFIILAAYVRLFITAWPADDLKENSEQLAFELYNASWLERPQSVIKDMRFMMQRSQKPLAISMGGLLPTLSLEYYLKYITTIFSYFTTIRAMFDD